MYDETKHVLGDDLPKENPWKDDRLGYAPFAERIAKVITNMVAPNGYFIGLHGQWGSGKSTILNFIVEYLRKHAGEDVNDEVIHIDFRPWIVSGHQDLIAAFFKILSEKLGPKDSRWKRFWKRTFRFINGTTDSLVDAAATVALTVDPSGGVASRYAGNLTKKSLNALLGRFLEEPSLQKAYENLKVQLGRSGKRFLVTIDDIDRLEDKDVKYIMQMVKSIGRLPNVVYLLAYDREIVWDALDQGVNRVGPRFAEKIVQQEIELPKPGKNRLLMLLDEQLSFLSALLSDGSLRWQYIVRDGMDRWIRSPRNVVRLSNAVKFSWPALRGEIDPQDLLAMEGLRLFDEGAFNWIRDNQDFLFTQGRFALAQDQAKNAVVEDLKGHIQKNLQSQVLRIMSVLFPQSAKSFEGQSFSQESFVEIAKRRGIGSEAGYDTYFGMHPSSDAIPKSTVKDLMSRLEDADGIEAIIRSYFLKRNSRGELMISKLLEELRVQYQARVPARPTRALLEALFRVGEEVIGVEWDGDPFVLSPRSQISFLIQNLLEQWGPEEAGERLIEAFQRGTSPGFLSDIYVDRGRELGAFHSDSSERPLISEEDFKKLGQVLIDKIQTAADDGTLKEASFFFDIVRSWAQIDNPKPVQAWLSAGINESAEFMTKVGQGLVGRSVSTGHRRYTMRENPAPELYDLQLLLDAGTKHLQRDDLTDDQGNLLTEIVRGSRELLKRQPSTPKMMTTSS
jgi:predicted KAP-like P-loop ATPase